MELELLPERFQNFHLMDAPDIHPGDGLIGRWRKHIERRVLAFVAAGAGVVEGRDRDLVRFSRRYGQGCPGEPVFLDRFWTSFIGRDLAGPPACTQVLCDGQEERRRRSPAAVFPLCRAIRN